MVFMSMGGKGGEETFAQGDCEEGCLMKDGDCSSGAEREG